MREIIDAPSTSLSISVVSTISTLLGGNWIALILPIAQYHFAPFLMRYLHTPHPLISARTAFIAAIGRAFSVKPE